MNNREQLKFKQNLFQNLRGIQVIMSTIGALLNFMDPNKSKTTTITGTEVEQEKFFELLKICYSIVLFYSLRNPENQK